jgi:hypothetical protein
MAAEECSGPEAAWFIIIGIGREAVWCMAADEEGWWCWWWWCGSGIDAEWCSPACIDRLGRSGDRSCRQAGKRGGVQAGRRTTEMFMLV